MWLNVLLKLSVFLMSHVICQELDIIGKNSMLYDPVNNLPYPCEHQPSKKKQIKRRFLHEFNPMKRSDGDGLPIKLQPCPFPNNTQEHRWLKTFRKKSSLPPKQKLQDFSKWLHNKRNDVIRKISRKEEKIRGELYAGTDVITGQGIGLSGATLGVLNILPYVEAFDTKTGMPYVCDPYKKKPDNKIDNRWKMIVPPCPDFKKCLFPWKEAKACNTATDSYSLEIPKKRRIIWSKIRRSF